MSLKSTPVSAWILTSSRPEKKMVATNVSNSGVSGRRRRPAHREVVTFALSVCIGGGHVLSAAASFVHPRSPIQPATATLALKAPSLPVLSTVSSKPTFSSTIMSSIQTGTQLSLARYDNLVSGVAEISIGFALGVLWSEYAVITTGCGPLNFSDILERICYQGVILSAGASLFTRIVTSGKDLTTYINEDYFGEGMLAEATLIQVRAAEWLSVLAVVGAFASLAVQIVNGEQMDGLSGIDVEMCRAIRDL